METTVNKTAATLLQLSAYTQYFFPLGNFIFPALIWSVKKNDSEFVDYSGKQLINFQLSMLIYTIIIMVVAIPFFVYSFFKGVDFTIAQNFNREMHNDSHWIIENFDTERITGLLAIAIAATAVFIIIKVAEFFLILYAAVKNTNGERFNYPLTIKFIK